MSSHRHPTLCKCRGHGWRIVITHTTGTARRPVTHFGRVPCTEPQGDEWPQVSQ